MWPSEALCTQQKWITAIMSSQNRPSTTLGQRKPLGHGYKKDNTFSTVARYRPQRPSKYADTNNSEIRPKEQTMANIMVRNFTLRPETAIERKTKEGPWFKKQSGLSRFPGDVPLYTIHKGHEEKRRRPGTAQPTRSKPRQYGEPNPGSETPKTPGEIQQLEDENKKLKAQLTKLQKKSEKRSRLTQLLRAEEARGEEAKGAMNQPYQLRQRQAELQAEIEELEQMEVTWHSPAAFSVYAPLPCDQP